MLSLVSGLGQHVVCDIFRTFDLLPSAAVLLALMRFLIILSLIRFSRPMALMLGWLVPFTNDLCGVILFDDAGCYGGFLEYWSSSDHLCGFLFCLFGVSLRDLKGGEKIFIINTLLNGFIV